MVWLFRNFCNLVVGSKLQTANRSAVPAVVQRGTEVVFSFFFFFGKVHLKFIVADRATEAKMSAADDTEALVPPVAIVDDAACPEPPVTDPEIQTKWEEVANSVTHGVGAVLSVVGVGFLLYFAPDNFFRLTFGIYGGSLILVFIVSTLYHSLPQTFVPRAKHVLRVLDHCSIYLLISGTYSVVLLGFLKDSVWGWITFGVSWGLALFGIIRKGVCRSDMSTVGDRDSV